MSYTEENLESLEGNIAEAVEYLNMATSDASNLREGIGDESEAARQWSQIEGEGYEDADAVMVDANLGAALSSEGYEDSDEIVRAMERWGQFSDLADVFADHPLTADMAEMCSDSNGVREVLDILSRRVSKGASNADAVVAAIRLLVEALADAGIQAGTVSDPPPFDNGSPVRVTDEQDNNQPTGN